MLYVIYTDPSKLKFTEYIAQFLVRATSPAKARVFAHKAYPKHPVNLWMKGVEVAPIQEITMLRPKPGTSVSNCLYLCNPGYAESTLRLLASGLGASCDQDTWLDASRSEFVPISAKGQGGVIARLENMTPAIAQSDYDRPVFVWRQVSDRWPNPSEDPISGHIPPSFKMEVLEG